MSKDIYVDYQLGTFLSAQFLREIYFRKLIVSEVTQAYSNL